MKFYITICTMLFLVSSVSIQAQNNNGKGKDKDKKEIVQKENKKAKLHRDQKQQKSKDDDYNDDDAVFSSNDDDGNNNKQKNKYKQKGKVKSNNGQGNAYGKDKYGLEGREFGQERARQAKLQNQKRRSSLSETVVVTERRLPTLTERIENARAILINQKPVLSAEVYETKRKKLEEAERKMTNLEKMVALAKTYEKN